MDNFEFIENLFTKKKVVTSTDNQLDEKDSYFMVNRWLSMHPSSFTAAVKASKLVVKLPRWAIGILLYNIIRKNPPPNLRYIKKDKKEKDKVLLEKISSYFHCDEKHAEEILVIFERNKIDVRQAFGLKR